MQAIEVDWCWNAVRTSAKEKMTHSMLGDLLIGACTCVLLVLMFQKLGEGIC